MERAASCVAECPSVWAGLLLGFGLNVLAGGLHKCRCVLVEDHARRRLTWVCAATGDSLGSYGSGGVCWTSAQPEAQSSPVALAFLCDLT